MRVLAKCSVKHDNFWHKAGETFDLPAEAVKALGSAVAVLDGETAANTAEPETAAVPAKEKTVKPRRAVRQKKSADK